MLSVSHRVLLAVLIGVGLAVLAAERLGQWAAARPVGPGRYRASVVPVALAQLFFFELARGLDAVWSGWGSAGVLVVNGLCLLLSAYGIIRALCVMASGASARRRLDG